MVDKVIGELPSISSLDDESLFVAEQDGQAVKVSGKQLTDFSNVETNAQVEQAKASAQAARTAQDAAEAAILKGPIIQNGTWWIYNQTAGAYQDTGINATGPQGIPGPTSSVNGISPDDSGNITLTASNVNAYSKTETDTLLQNNDPRQWGLGSVDGKMLTIDDDLDNIIINGWYSWSSSSPTNAPVQYGRMILFGYSNTVTQIVSSDMPGWKNILVMRSRFQGTWTPWEYVNPPMLLGVEYRTTERYLGKPVYTQVITVDGGVAGAIYYTEKSVSGADQLVGYDAKLWDWSIPTNILGGQTGKSKYIIDAAARVNLPSSVNCYFYSPGRDTTRATAYFTVRYTKSTD